MIKISQLTLTQQSGTLILEQRAKCKEQNRVLKILYFRELPVGVRQYTALETILCEQCTEFSRRESVSVTGILPLFRSLLLQVILQR